MILRLGYCPSCRELISSDILPESKKQALAAAELEYEATRDRIRAEKDRSDSETGFGINFGGGDTGFGIDFGGGDFD